MSEVHTATIIDTVNPKVKKGRARFPKPENGFELAADFIRSSEKLALKIPERLLYLELCDYVSDKSYQAYPSVTTLAKSMKVTPRAIRIWLATLEEKGFL